MEKSPRYLILGIIIIIVIGSIYLVAKPAGKSNKEMNEKGAGSGEKTIQGNNIPGTNYTCEEIVPEKLLVLFPAGNSTLHPNFETGPDPNYLKNNEKIIAHGYCERQNQAGQNINLFSCRGYFNTRARISPEGLVEKTYKVDYTFNLDNRECSFKYDTVKGSLMSCKVISTVCSWQERT